MAVRQGFHLGRCLEIVFPPWGPRDRTAPTRMSMWDLDGEGYCLLALWRPIFDIATVSGASHIPQDDVGNKTGLFF